MAYLLNANQIASLTAERNTLQESLDNFDSTTFIASVDNSVTEAQNVDDGASNAWISASDSSDGVGPHEDVLTNLDGQTVTNPIPGSEGLEDSAGALFTMGTVTAVVGPVAGLVTIASLALDEPFKVSNSARIRLNVNRYYPDVDDKDDRPSSDARNVFDDHPWEAFEGNEGSELDYTGLRTIYQDGIYGTARGTPGFTTQSGGIAVDNAAVEGTVQTSIDDGGQACFVGDNERFFIAMGNYLSASHSTGTLAGTTNLVLTVSNVSIRGILVGGIASISSSASMTGTTNPATYSPSVEDILSLNGGIVRVVGVDSSNTMCATTGMAPSEMTTCTTTATIRYVSITQSTPSVGTLSNGSQGANNAKRDDYLNLKRYTTAIVKTDDVIATPAINTQAEVDAEIVRLIALLGTATSGLYAFKYLIANTRSNWNDGTISAVFSRRFSRLNLFNPILLEERGLIAPGTAGTFDNEYSRTEAKIAQLQSILDGAS